MAQIIKERQQIFAHGMHMGASPATLKCDCGSRITLSDPLDNTCERCGRNYNMSGQLVMLSTDPDVDEPLYED